MLALAVSVRPRKNVVGTGEFEHIPKDKAHEGLAMMKERGIVKSQLHDCYVCHR